MDAVALAIGFSVGAAAGAAVGWLLARARASAESAGARASAEAAAGERDRVAADLASARVALAEAEKGQAALAARLDAERTRAEEKIGLLKDAEVRVREAFQALSSEALKSNNRAFLDLAKETLGQFQQGAKGDLDARQKAIDELLKPVRESLGRVDETMRSAEQERAKAHGALQEQVRSLATAKDHLQAETANLVKALRAPQVRGRWGEVQLKRVVEMAGMLDHCDFVEQESVATEGGRLRPDLVIRLPGGKRIIVDSKAPLAAYLDAVEAKEDAARDAGFRDHARQVRDHVVALGGKAYWDQFDDTPDFVFMFLPGESFLSEALRQDPALIEFGAERRVILAGPTTLLTLLLSVHHGWQQERIAENARRISELGQVLYERIGTLAEHFQKVGKGLGSAVDAYNGALGSLETRVLVAARKFRELGVPSAVEIPEIESVERSPRSVPASEMKALPRRPGEDAA